MHNSIENIIVAGAVEQRRLHILGLGRLGQNNCIGLLAFDVRVEVDNLDADLEVV
jgi:hypothetical protein